MEFYSFYGARDLPVNLPLAMQPLKERMSPIREFLNNPANLPIPANYPVEGRNILRFFSYR